jgi:hypothetical protein
MPYGWNKAPTLAILQEIAPPQNSDRAAVKSVDVDYSGVNLLDERRCHRARREDH